jgi:hypothetical protein
MSVLNDSAENWGLTAQVLWVGYHPQLEAAILPQVDAIARETERILKY